MNINHIHNRADIIMTNNRLSYFDQFDNNTSNFFNNYQTGGKYNDKHSKKQKRATKRNFVEDKNNNHPNGGFVPIIVCDKPIRNIKKEDQTRRETPIPLKSIVSISDILKSRKNEPFL